MHCGAMLDAAQAGDLDLFYIIGGNFLETMPDPRHMREALLNVPCRVHQDIHLNSSMLPDSGEVTILLPACTRYEQRGGGTQVSTERRIRLSPEVPGPRIAEARSEWEILVDLGRRALDGPARDAIGFDSADQIRAEIDRVMPMYRGIVELKAEGQSFQYGGPLLCKGGHCPGLPGGRAIFSALEPPGTPPEEGRFAASTRRGAQFNSILFREHDAITGGLRDDVFMNPADAGTLGLKPGDFVVLESALGSMRARVRLDDVRPGSLQTFWPEANILVPRSYDPASGEPDYNAQVTIRKAD